MDVTAKIRQDSGTWAETKCLLDSGSQLNLITQRFAKAHKLRPTGQAPPRAYSFEGDSISLKDEYYATISVRDDVGVVKEIPQYFYGCEPPGYEVILGTPWLEGIQAGQYDWVAKKWRYSSSCRVEVVTPKEFAIDFLSRGEAYALVISQMPGNATVPVWDIRIEALTPTIPEEYLDYADVFSDEKAATLPELGGVEHLIETTANPPFRPLYNLSAVQLKALREYLDYALARGWITYSTSPARAPILFVLKKDEGLRLCVDYRGLNKVTIKNRYPLPLINEAIDRLVGAVRFTKVDLKDAYHRIRIKLGDEWKTAFRTRYGHFEYQVMPFGLTNALATFQAYINQALGGLLNDFYIVYLDDILIYSYNASAYEEHVQQVLKRLRQYKLYANLKKCVFSTETVEFLGFIISASGVSVDPAYIATIIEWPEPQTFTQVQQFLGFANFY